MVELRMVELRGKQTGVVLVFLALLSLLLYASPRPVFLLAGIVVLLLMLRSAMQRVKSESQQGRALSADPKRTDRRELWRKQDFLLTSLRTARGFLANDPTEQKRDEIHAFLAEHEAKLAVITRRLAVYEEAYSHAITDAVIQRCVNAQDELGATKLPRATIEQFQREETEALSEDLGPLLTEVCLSDDCMNDQIAIMEEAMARFYRPASERNGAKGFGN
jgi:hypothetical protein